ncbi:hypothetical protein RJ55_04856 [Drechmeria coniospora]|nr:hypothetical protein RJ55_04856 [Drechmeria coniospora]
MGPLCKHRASVAGTQRIGTVRPAEATDANRETRAEMSFARPEYSARRVGRRPCPYRVSISDAADVPGGIGRPPGYAAGLGRLWLTTRYYSHQACMLQDRRTGKDSASRKKKVVCAHSSLCLPAMAVVLSQPPVG